MDVLDTRNATIIGRNMNVRKLLERKVRQHGDKPFIIFIDKDSKEEIVTYNRFDEMVNRLANWLLGRGLSKGDFVLTHLPNSTGFLVALHACTKIGVVMIPSIIFDVADDLEYKLNFSEAKMVITDGEYYEMFDSIRDKSPAVKDIVIYRSEEKIPGTHDWNEILENSSPDLAPVEIDPLDAAQMLFTSGTTARPKGVILTHANFLYIGEICARSFAVTPDDRYLLVLPLFHVNAQCISYFPCLTAGASMVVLRTLQRQQFFSFDPGICLHALFAGFRHRSHDSGPTRTSFGRRERNVEMPVRHCHNRRRMGHVRRQVRDHPGRSVRAYRNPGPMHDNAHLGRT